MTIMDYTFIEVFFKNFKNDFHWALSSKLGFPHQPFWYIQLTPKWSIGLNMSRKGDFRGRSTRNG